MVAKHILISMAFIVVTQIFLGNSLYAQQIKAKNKQGNVALIEIVSVEGRSLKFKTDSGAVFTRRLDDFEEDTLIQIIQHLSKRPEETASIADKKMNQTAVGRERQQNNLSELEVTANQLNNIPEQFTGKQVKISNCTYNGTRTFLFGGDTRSVQLVEKHINFYVSDEDGDSFFNLVISKQEADTLFAIKKKQKITVSGRLKEVSSYFPDTGRFWRKDHFFFVENIELVKENEKDK